MIIIIKYKEFTLINLIDLLNEYPNHFLEFFIFFILVFLSRSLSVFLGLPGSFLGGLNFGLFLGVLFLDRRFLHDVRLGFMVTDFKVLFWLRGLVCKIGGIVISFFVLLFSKVHGGRHFCGYFCFSFYFFVKIIYWVYYIILIFDDK